MVLFTLHIHSPEAELSHSTGRAKMNGTLECDIPIYQQPYFVFDPEDIQRNQANVLQRLQFTSGFMVTNRAGNTIEVFSTDPSSLFVSRNMHVVCL